ncbi:MAG: hypothetical protein QNJ20_02715 [Paracoccaceae bacterium]|nr:hypothetical protein [Paracoccaceae bacterium]
MSAVKVLGHALLVLLLTLLTQLGGIAWLLALFFRRRLAAFVGLYIVLSLSAVWVAPMFGRTALSCFDAGPLQVQSPLYCALNRTYVTPEMKGLLQDVAVRMERRHPGTVTLVLDASFPFFDGFPLLPHLSHDDGEKADLAFFYRDGSGYLPGAVRSPIGYFAFEPGPTDCPARAADLRWDLPFLQPFWRALDLDRDRTRDLLQALAEDDRTGKILIEPHLVQTLGASHPKLRFQGCRAARHDDHIHVQL